ncbi:MAG: hypothetical protein Q7R33_09690 [Nitrosarchaeum sp.]|nr:hypothetical protein [Nitrosarchaeum sp.]
MSRHRVKKIIIPEIFEIANCKRKPRLSVSEIVKLGEDAVGRKFKPKIKELYKNEQQEKLTKFNILFGGI